MADHYILAARNKIASAARHLAALNKLRAGDESERSQVQDAYEDIISRGFSAGDQLAEAIALKAGLRIRNNSPERLLRKLAEEPIPTPDEFESCIQHLREWAEEAIVRDARARRNTAVHHHYEKRPYKPEGIWMLDEVTIRGEVSPYQGLLDVHSYCATFVEKLASTTPADPDAGLRAWLRDWRWRGIAAPAPTNKRLSHEMDRFTGSSQWVTSYAEQVTVGPAVRGRNRFDPDRVTIEWRQR